MTPILQNDIDEMSLMFDNIFISDAVRRLGNTYLYYSMNWICERSAFDLLKGIIFGKISNETALYVSFLSDNGLDVEEKTNFSKNGSFSIIKENSENGTTTPNTTTTSNSIGENTPLNGDISLIDSPSEKNKIVSSNSGEISSQTSGSSSDNRSENFTTNMTKIDPYIKIKLVEMENKVYSKIQEIFEQFIYEYVMV